MAKSLDKLIDFLLEEIALVGEGGFTFGDIAQATSSFYNNGQPTVSHPNRLPSSKLSDQVNEQANLDNAFLQKVWIWICRHPDTFTVEDHGSGSTATHPVKSTRHRSSTSVVVSADHQHGSPHELSQAADNDIIHHDPDMADASSTHSETRVLVGQDRMYIAICGHLPDSSRVLPMEWQLLSHIAAARKDGILQGDLVRVSSQDKRSVPKRTDALHKKGYIDKEYIYIKGNRTSKIKLLRYKDALDSITSTPSIGTQAPKHLTSRSCAEHLFQILREQRSISKDDLSRALNVGQDASKQTLNRILQHFIRVGCVEYVETASTTDEVNSNTQARVQLVRLPEGDSWCNLDNDDLDFDASIDWTAEDANIVSLPTTASATIGHPAARQTLSERSTTNTRVIPQWNPDRILSNIFVEVCEAANRDGISNLQIRKQISGTLVRRVIESHLVKISNSSLQVQSSGLLHLAVLRSRRTIDGILQYIHFAFDAYADLVKDGKASWKDVSGGEDFVRQLMELSESEPSSISNNVKRDKLGFPLLEKRIGQVNGGEISLSDAIRQQGFADHKLTGEDLVLSKNMKKRTPNLGSSNGDSVTRPRTVTPRAKKNSALAMQSKLTKLVIKPQRTLGRPRRFLEGTEKWWRNMFLAIKVANNPQWDKKSTAGVMQDPSALDIFNTRPEQFEPVLVRVMKAGFPLPTEASSISEEWITTMSRILDRYDDGLYITPTGQQSEKRSKPSKVLIYKSPRISELSLPDVTALPTWCFLSSSAAHSAAIHRFSTSRHLPCLVQASYPLWTSVGQITDHEAEKAGDTELRVQLDPSFSNEICQNADSIGLEPRNSRSLPAVGQASEMQDSQRSIEIADVSELGRSGIPRTEGHSDVVVHGLQVPELLVLNPSVTENQFKISPPVKRSQRSARTVRTRNTTKKTAEPTKSPPPGVGRRFDHVLIPALHTEDFNRSTLQVTPGDPIESQTPPAVDTSRTKDVPAPLAKGLAGVRLADQVSTSPADVYPTILYVDPQTATYAEQDDRIPELEPTMVDDWIKAPLELQTTTAIDEVEVTSMPELIPELISQPQSAHLDSDAEAETDDVEGERAKRAGKLTPAERGRRDVTRVTRSILNDLIDLCSGLAPFDQSTFRRALAPRWIESGMTTKPPTARIVRGNLKTLSTSSHFKLITFAFKSPRGVMLTKSIIARRHFGTASPEVLALQEKIKLAAEADYIPPELEAEEQRQPSASNKRELQKILTEEDEPETTQSRKKRKKSTAARRGVRCSPPPGAAKGASPEVTHAHTSFLTLKVPRLHTLNLSSVYDIKNCKAPAPPPASLTSGVLDQPAPRRRGRPLRRHIVWTKLPRSIEEVPGMKAVHKKVRQQDYLDRASAMFEAEVDCVTAWEKDARPFEQQPEDLIFINHEFVGEWSDFEVHTYQFVNLTILTDMNEQKEVDMPEEVSWPPFAEALSNIDPEDLLGVAGSAEIPVYNFTRKRRKPREDDDQYVDERPKKRRRRKTGDRRISRTKDVPGEVNFKSKARRNQNIRHVPVEVRYRLILCIIIVRTLAGGIEKYIDWKIVSRFFPGQDISYVQLIWRGLWHKYRADVRDMNESFQESYLEALAVGEVPSVNFNDLAETDWEGILQWALEGIDKVALNKVDDLPALRRKFEKINQCAFNEPVNLRDMLLYGANITGPRKEELVSSIVFGIDMPVTNPRYPLPSPTIPAEDEEKDPILSRAKSWVTAIVLTPDSQYNPISTHTKLLRIIPDSPSACETTMQQALRSLQREKVISKVVNASSGKSRLDEEDLTNIRLWVLSSKFTEIFETRRQINISMLHTAAKFKLEVLDRAFARGEAVTYMNGTMLEDGVMVAILNLQAQGYIRVRAGPDKPDTRYGLDWENHGYTTKLIDKAHLGFSIVIEPGTATIIATNDSADDLISTQNIGDSYVFGDPMLHPRLSTPIPTHDPADLLHPEHERKIPMWFTIDRALLPDRWSSYVAAIVGLISIRPGIGVVEISRSLWSMMTVWEVRLVVAWLDEVGAVKRTIGGGRDGNGHMIEQGDGEYDGGWETRDDGWWWMCVGAY